LLTDLGFLLTTNNGKDVSCGNIQYYRILKKIFRFLPSILDITENFQDNKLLGTQGEP